ncbi:MAG: HTTM domain-containing protein [Bacteroidia bacterium]|nr:HTTM domain-containing protein [Bacteroidia bacterium]
MKKITAYFFNEYKFSWQAVYFKMAMYLFVAFKAIYWLSYYSLFFGEHAIAFNKIKSIGVIKDLAFLLYNNSAINFGYVFIFGTLLFLGLSYFLKKVPFVFEFLIWFCVINIHNKIYPTLTGGDLLLNQLLFFNCFLAKSYKQQSTDQNPLSICFHNFGALAIIIQVCLVYFIAAVAKLYSNDWLTGSAIAHLGEIEHFNLFSGAIIKNESLNCCLNYIVLFYQLFFPFLIWLNKIKKQLLFIGVIMHVYIAFVTGLVGFGLIMIITYVFFWPFKKQNA